MSRWRGRVEFLLSVIMVALRNRADHYILHTLRLIARQPWRNCVTSLRSAHWLASSLKLAARCPVSGCLLVIYRYLKCSSLRHSHYKSGDCILNRLVFETSSKCLNCILVVTIVLLAETTVLWRHKNYSIIIITFCTTRRRCGMYIGHARLCVCPRLHA